MALINGNKDIRFGIRFPQALKDEFVAVCEEQMTTPSAEIRKMVLKYVTDYRKANK